MSRLGKAKAYFINSALNFLRSKLLEHRAERTVDFKRLGYQQFLISLILIMFFTTIKINTSCQRQAQYTSKNISNQAWFGIGRRRWTSKNGASCKSTYLALVDSRGDVDCFGFWKFSAATSTSSKRTSVDFGGAVFHRVVQGDGGGIHPHPVAVLEADFRSPPCQKHYEILQMAMRHSLYLTLDTSSLTWMRSIEVRLPAF